MRNAFTAIAFLAGLALASAFYFGLRIDFEKLSGEIWQKDGFQLVEKIDLNEKSNDKKEEVVETKKVVEKSTSQSSKKKIKQNTETQKDSNSNQLSNFSSSDKISSNNNLNNLFSASIETAATAVVITLSTTTVDERAITAVEENILNVSTQTENNQNNAKEIISSQVSSDSSQISVNIAINHILISEVVAGIEGNSNYEFIEFYNPTANDIDLTGWSIKKKSSTGNESSLLSAARFEGKSIGAGKYFLAVNEGGYDGQVQADAFWAKSNTLAYSDNSVILYDKSGEKIEEVSWQEILKGQSLARQSWDNYQFIVQSPTPQNSNY